MKTTDMTKGSIVKHIIVFAIPILLTYFLQNMYNLADSLMVGRFCDGNGLAAIGTTEPICNCMIGLFLGIGSGISIAVARAYGAGDVKGVHKAVHNGIALSIVCGVIITVLGIAAAPLMLTLIRTDEAILGQAELYLRIYFAGGLFLVVYNIGAGILRAVGDSKHPLMFLIVSAVINVGLNYVLIVICNLGVMGAAIATTASQLVSAVLVIITLVRCNDVHRLFIRDIRFHKESLALSLKVGIPTGLQSMVISLSNVIIQAYVNDFGPAATAGSSAANKVDNFILMFSQSISLALMTFAGQNIGAGNNKRAKKGLITSILIASGCMLVLGVFACAFSEQIVSVFVDKADPDFADIIEFGGLKVVYISSFYFMVGINDSMSSYLRASGKATAPMIIYILTMCLFRILWITVLRFGIPFLDPEHLSSVFTVYPVSYLPTFLMLLGYFLIVERKEKQKA